jgi:hypothetical protein
MLAQTSPARPAAASGLAPEVIRVASSPVASSLAAACGRARIGAVAASGIVVRKLSADLCLRCLESGFEPRELP